MLKRSRKNSVSSDSSLSVLPRKAWKSRLTKKTSSTITTESWASCQSLCRKLDKKELLNGQRLRIKLLIFTKLSSEESEKKKEP